MKVAHIALAIAVLAGAGSAAAFQEQRQGAPAPAVPVAPQAETPAPVAVPVAPAGTEVRVPGFGKLGVLPKIDFGLELLYGGNEQQRAVQSTVPPAEAADGMAVRGSFKHKF